MENRKVLALVICLFDKTFLHKNLPLKDVKQKEEERNEIWRKAGRGSACKREKKTRIQATI